ncbi:hypothetical protein MRX96_021271 [Rhipicephalus microplus]
MRKSIKGTTLNSCSHSRPIIPKPAKHTFQSLLPSQHEDDACDSPPGTQCFWLPADATTNQAALNAFKKSYEVIEKIIADKQQAAEQEESVAETLKALANLQANVDPESEEYFLAQLFQKAVVWLVQKGVSKGVEYGVGKAIKG